MSDKIRKVQKSLWVEEDCRDSHMHIIERMNEVIRSLVLKTSSTHRDLEYQNYTLKFKLIDGLKQRESKTQARTAFKHLKKDIEMQTTDRVLDLNKLEKEVKSHQRELEETEKRKFHNDQLVEQSIIKAIADYSNEVRENLMFFRF